MKNWKIWEQALAVALAASLLGSAAFLHSALENQQALSQKMIRLHVLANSDSEADQAVKLRVKDAVFARVEALLDSAADQSAAEETLDASLEELTALAEETLREAGSSETVRVSLENASFPTRDYGGFALPAGEYRALRVLIGEGKGHNWWCVVFPPLCAAGSTDWKDAALAAGLTQADLRLMSGEGERYVLKFRSVELWNRLMAALGR